MQRRLAAQPRALVQAARARAQPVALSAPAGSLQTKTLWLPFHREPQEVTYEVINGLAFFEGDIILDDAETRGGAGSMAPAQTPRGGNLGVSQEPLTARNGARWLWPGGVIPFTIHDVVPARAPLRQAIQAALTHWQTRTRIRFIPRTPQHRDWVEFVPDPNNPGCGSSKIGRQGGRQAIRLLPTAPAACIIHEVGHAVGLWHEQARFDRDRFVEILWDNISKRQRHNFAKHVDDGMAIGPYDLQSVMHYRPTAFGNINPATGGPLPTIQSRVPGQAVGGQGAYASS